MYQNYPLALTVNNDKCQKFMTNLQPITSQDSSSLYQLLQLVMLALWNMTLRMKLKDNMNKNGRDKWNKFQFFSI